MTPSPTAACTKDITYRHTPVSNKSSNGVDNERREKCSDSTSSPTSNCSGILIHPIENGVVPNGAINASHHHNTAPARDNLCKAAVLAVNDDLVKNNIFHSDSGVFENDTWL